MSRGLSSSFITALNQPNVRFLFLCRLEFDGGTIAFNSTLREITYNTVTYTGLGTLGNVSPIEENLSMDPSEFEVSLSAVNDSLVSAILAEEFLNRKAVCLIGVMDENDQIIDTTSYFNGKMDSVRGSIGDRSHITVTVRDEISDWNRPRIERYTDRDQQRKYPGDLGFEYVPQVANKKVIWPASTWFEKYE